MDLPKIRDGVYLINLHDYKSIGTPWIALYMNVDTVADFDRFGVEHKKRLKSL